MILDTPKYLPGEIVLHRVSSRMGEVLYPAIVVGLLWSEDRWEYSLSVFADHPQYGNSYEYEIEWFNSWQLEKIDPGMRQLLMRSFCWED